MPFCKNCGGDISINDKRCPYCGSPIIKETESFINTNRNEAIFETYNSNNKEELNELNNNVRISPNKPAINNNINLNNEENLFSFSNWKDVWKKRCVNGSGIILTNTLGFNKKEFNNSLKQFIEFKKRNGTYYEIFDLADQIVFPIEQIKISSIIKALKEIYNVKTPNYLLIIGDDTVVPKMIFDNVTNENSRDDDKFVPSDFAYICLDTSSPWDGKEYNLECVPSVGRIPASRENNFNEAISYMNNIMKFKARNSLNGFAYSAKEWEDTSINVFEPISKTVYTSPRYVVNDPRYSKTESLFNLNSYNALGINLHGSSTDHYWFGQIESILPRAFHKTSLPKSDEGYVLCCEACYGAKSKIRGNDDSILINALKNNCIGFVGSTMIAYGSAYGTMSCADVIANVFFKSLKKGMPLGECFINSLIELLKGEKNEHVYKTLAEFAFYGDPSIVFYSKQFANVAYGEKIFKVENVKNNLNLSSKLVSLDFDSNDVFKNVANTFGNEAEFERITNLIKNKSYDFISSYYSELKEEKPKLFKVAGKNEYRSNYSKTIDNIEEYVSIYLDEFGNIKDVYISK